MPRPADAATALTGWLDAPRQDRGIHFATDSGEWDHVTYAELVADAQRLAHGLRERGVGPGSVVGIVDYTGRLAVTSVFATWFAGGTVSLIAPPMMSSVAEFLQYLSALVATAEPTVVITTTDLADLVTQGATTAGRAEAVWAVTEYGDTALAERGELGELAVLQFTSGSTGNPKGVRVTWTALRANLDLIVDVLGWHDGDALSNWVPLYHDMGLVGGLFLPSITQGDLWLMRPDQFIRDPAMWLETFAPGRAVVTAVPSFALSHVARRVKPQRAEQIDLSGLRHLVLGSEAADPVALQAFTDFAQPLGFDPAGYMPAYGMAENVLLNSVGGRDGQVHIARVDWSTLRSGLPVKVLETAILQETRIEPDAGWIVSCGHPRPTDGITIDIVDDDGVPVADGVLGQVVLSGTSITGGYYKLPPGASSMFVGDQVHTGDGAFRHEGTLYVLGRTGNSMKVLGRSVYAEDVDRLVAGATGLAKGRLISACVTEEGKPHLLLFAETEAQPWAEDALRFLRAEFGTALRITVAVGGRGLLQRTTSGKPRRRYMWQQFQDGNLDVTVVPEAG